MHFFGRSLGFDEGGTYVVSAVMFDFCDFFGFSSGFFALERSFNSTGSVFLGSIITCRVSSEAKDGVAGLFDASGTKVS